MRSEKKQESEDIEELAPEDIFECKMCGECCRGFGGTYVNSEDIERIAEYLGVGREEFLRKYCQKSGSGIVLAQKEDGYCVFFKENCTIHPVKPRMCKAWPFIQAVVKDMANWKAMANSCRGIRTDFPDEAIVECVRKVIEERGE